MNPLFSACAAISVSRVSCDLALNLGPLISGIYRVGIAPVWTEQQAAPAGAMTEFGE